jgi:hypothetical protein
MMHIVAKLECFAVHIAREILLSRLRRVMVTQDGPEKATSLLVSYNQYGGFPWLDSIQPEKASNMLVSDQPMEA